MLAEIGTVHGWPIVAELVLGFITGRLATLTRPGREAKLAPPVRSVPAPMRSGGSGMRCPRCRRHENRLGMLDDDDYAGRIREIFKSKGVLAMD